MAESTVARQKPLHPKKLKHSKTVFPVRTVMASGKVSNSARYVQMMVTCMYRFGTQEMITSSILKARWMSI